MRQKKAISDAVIERLPLYYRDLLLLQDAGIDIISSEKLGERLGITPEQIRKDLTCFGAFGKKGVGYYVSELCQQIVEIIGLQQHWKIGIAGIGHLGWALANYKTFGRLGFRTAGLFDVDHRIIGQNVGGVVVTPIADMKDVIRKEGIQIGIITTLPPSRSRWRTKWWKRAFRGFFPSRPCASPCRTISSYSAKTCPSA